MLTSEEVNLYLSECGTEFDAAVALAHDIAAKNQEEETPGVYEVHHALYLLRKAQGKSAPSCDYVRAEMKSKKLID